MFSPEQKKIHNVKSGYLYREDRLKKGNYDYNRMKSKIPEGSSLSRYGPPKGVGGIVLSLRLFDNGP